MWMILVTESTAVTQLTTRIRISLSRYTNLLRLSLTSMEAFEGNSGGCLLSANLDITLAR